MYLRRIIIISCLVLPVYFPQTANGSTQPIQEDIANIINNDTENDLNESTKSIVSQVRTIYEAVSGGNWNTAIGELLGALGIINPASFSMKVNNDTEDNPYAFPETPSEVRELEQYLDILRNSIPQRLSSVVFGREGQEKMANDTDFMRIMEQNSHDAQLEIILKSDDLSQILGENRDYAEIVSNKAEEAAEAKASQDVLKALAAQNEDISQIMAGNSEQLTILGEIAALQSVQLNGINSNLTILNSKAQTLEVLVASQNYLLSQVDSALGQQKDYQQYRDSLERGINQNMSRAIFIPGLFKDELPEIDSEEIVDEE